MYIFKSKVIVLYIMIVGILLVAGYVQIIVARESLHNALGEYGVMIAKLQGKDTTGMLRIWYEGFETVEATYQPSLMLGIGVGVGIGLVPFILLWRGV